MGRFIKIIRYKEWYDSKWNIYWYVFMLYWIRHRETDALVCVRYFAAVVLFSFFLLAFGYAFNDFSDTKEDLAVGKTNMVSQLSRSWQLALLLLLFLMGIVIPSALVPRWGMLLITSFSFLMAFLYSYRRFGIKQRGFWGLVVSSLAQRVCPLFTVFYLFDDWTVTSVLITLLSFVVGLRWILIHQAEDLENDKVSHTKSFVIGLNNSESKLLSIITTVFACELLCLVTIIILNASFSLTLLVPVAYIVFQLVVMPFWLKIGWKRMILSYDFAPLADFYFLWSGVYVTTALTIHNPICAVLFLFVFYFGYRYIVLDYKYLKLNHVVKKGLLLGPTDDVH